MARVSLVTFGTIGAGSAFHLDIRVTAAAVALRQSAPSGAAAIDRGRERHPSERSHEQSPGDHDKRCLSTAAGMVGRVVVSTSGTAAGAIMDSTSTTFSAAATIFGGTFAAAGSVLALNFPLQSGLAVLPAGATLAVSWN